MTASISRRLFGVVAVTSFIVLGLPLAANAVRSADPPVTAAFSPATVALGVGETRLVVLQVVNPSATPLTDVNVAVTYDLGLAVSDPLVPTGETPEPSPPPTDDASAEADLRTPFPITSAPSRIEAGQTATIAIEVSRTANIGSERSALAQISYSSGAASRTEVIVAPLSVTVAAAGSAATAPVAITASSTKTTLVQYQATDMFFVVTNSSSHTQTLSAITLTYPKFLAMSYVPAEGDEIAGEKGRLTLNDLTIDPGSSALLGFHLDASNSVQPGESLLLLSSTATDSTTEGSFNVYAAHPVEFSVLGESELLEALGVPALFFVPGLVYAVGLWLLWTKLHPREEFTLSQGTFEGKVVLWVVALFPSLLFPGIYAWVTGLWGEPRDYRRVYGLDDILYAWLLAMALAAITWAAALAVRYVVRRFFLPLPGDSASTLLDKLSRRPGTLKLRLRSAVLTRDGITQSVLLLRRVGQKFLVAPRIMYSVSGGGASTRLAAIRTAINTNPRELNETLRTHVVTPEYETEKPLCIPTVVDATELSSWRTPIDLVNRLR